MVQQSNIKMPLVCWEAIKGTNEEYNVLGYDMIEHVIMYPGCFFDEDNNPLEWIAAKVRVPESIMPLIESGAESMACNFAAFYDTELLDITFEV